MSEEKTENLWQRLRRKYLLSVVNEETLTEQFHLRLNLLSVFTFLTLTFLLTLVLFSLLILYTPIKNVLPGYGEDIRRSLISETARVDSLGTMLEAQRRYLESMKQVLAGDATTEYEQKEKDNLQLFDVQNTKPVYTIFRPAHGVVTETYAPELKRFGIRLQTPENENVTAVLAGTVVLLQQEEDNTYTMMLQHAQHLSIYRTVGYPMRKVGEVVQAGETIGLAAKDKMLGFELWLDGRSINPEEVIAF